MGSSASDSKEAEASPSAESFPSRVLPVVGTSEAVGESITLDGFAASKVKGCRQSGHF